MPDTESRQQRRAAAEAANALNAELDARLAALPGTAIGPRTRSMWYTLTPEQKEVLLDEAEQRL